MAVSEFVTFTIQVNNAGLSQLGFGTPMLLSYGASFTGMRSYSQYADVLADFAAGTPEANIANAVFSQSPHPTTLKIYAAANKPTKQYTIGAIAVQNATAYQVQVDGPGITSTLASYTSDSTATAQEIHNGLVTQLNAVTGKNYTATFAPLVGFTPETFTVLDQATGKLTATAHGLNTGDGPFQLTTTGSLPTGLSTLTNYWAIKFDTNTIQLASSLANALAGTAIVLSSNGTGTNTINSNTALSPILPILVTGNSAGNWFSLECKGNAALLSNKETHADPGIATDIANAQLADPDWYWLLTQFNSKACVTAAAAAIEAMTKVYVVSVVDSDAVNTAAGNTDTLDALNTLGYKRTCGKYHPSPIQCFAATSVGVVAPQNPGKWTEAFKTLVGVSAVTLTSTQRTNLRARRAGTYTTEKGRSITWDGKVFSTVYGYLDITVGLDWLTDQVVTAAFGVLVSLPKVAYTDEHIDLIAAAVRGVLHDAVSDAHNLLDPGDLNDPTNLPPTIAFPSVSQISPGTRALRQLPNGTVTGRLTGAVQNIAFIATLSF